MIELELLMAGIIDVEDEYEVDDKATRVFSDIMTAIDIDAPWTPVVAIMPCGGWRADWFVQEPAVSVRLIVSAATGVKPVIFIELGGDYGVEIAEPHVLKQHLRWLKFITASPVTVLLGQSPTSISTAE